MLRFAMDKDVLMVAVSGELDLVEAREFQTKVDELLLANGCVKELVVDLSEVSFVDSTGLGALIGRYKVMKLRGGSVRVVGAQESVYKVLEMAGLRKIMRLAR